MDEQKIDAMRKGGKILGNLLRDLKEYVKPGMSELEVDAWVRKEIIKRGAGVAYDMLPKGEEFPGAICISVNDELVHGAPTDYVFEEGDKVSFDLDVFYKGYFTDSAFTMIVGDKGNPAVKKMISVTESAMWEGIEQVKPGAHIGDISAAVEKVLRAGHGYKLKAGDVICIEPMSCLGKPKNYVDKDNGWTVKMKDGSIGCHCEHSVLVTENGYEVLTLPD